MKVSAINICLLILSIISYASADSSCVWPTPAGTTTSCGPSNLMLTFGLYLTPYVIAHVVIFYIMVRKFYNDNGDSK